MTGIVPIWGAKIKYIYEKSFSFTPSKSETRVSFVVFRPVRKLKTQNSKLTMADIHLHPHYHDAPGHHHEEHFTHSEFVTDVVIGMSDGLTVPFALAAGLSGAVDASSIVLTAGIAEIVAGNFIIDTSIAQKIGRAHV